MVLNDQHDTDTRNSGLTRLFAYGTLRPGQVNFVRIERWVVSVQRGTIEGDLVDLRVYPALIPGAGLVEGELLSLRQQALEIADRTEGCESDETRSFYVRREVVVSLADGSTERAWAYFFPHPNRLADRPRAAVGERDGRVIHAWPSHPSESLPIQKQSGSKSQR